MASADRPISRWFAALALVVSITGCGTPQSSSTAAPRDAESAVQPTAAAGPNDSAEALPTPSHAQSSPGEPEVERASAEAYLLSGFRTDPAVGQPIDLASCTPRREGLPGNATHGVECAIAEGPAEQVGAYLFPTPEDARRVYEERLAQYGVELDTFRDLDSCGNEGPMYPSLPSEEHLVPRSGTFLNENGYANLRALFPPTSSRSLPPSAAAVYVGVLGRTADCGELDLWAHFPRELGVIPNPVNVWYPPPAAD